MAASGAKLVSDAACRTEIYLILNNDVDYNLLTFIFVFKPCDCDQNGAQRDWDFLFAPEGRMHERKRRLPGIHLIRYRSPILITGCICATLFVLFLKIIIS